MTQADRDRLVALKKAKDKKMTQRQAARGVTQRGVGESASAVWKAVQEQHARLLPAAFDLRGRD